MLHQLLLGSLSFIHASTCMCPCCIWMWSQHELCILSARAVLLFPIFYFSSWVFSLLIYLLFFFDCRNMQTLTGFQVFKTHESSGFLTFYCISPCWCPWSHFCPYLFFHFSFSVICSCLLWSAPSLPSLSMCLPHQWLQSLKWSVDGHLPWHLWRNS